MIHPISTAEEATDIPEMSVTERGPVNSTARCVEMFVFLHVNSFVGCHAKMGNLVDLAGEEEEAPGEGEELGGCQEEYGGPAGSEAGETREAVVLFRSGAGQSLAGMLSGAKKRERK